MSVRTITVFGGSGFIGRYVVERLAALGHRVRVATRRPNNALFLKPMGAVGQVQTLAANIRDDASVARAVAGADVVINLVGVLQSSGSQTFDALQAEGAARIARLSAAAGVGHLVHMSAIGADSLSPANYARTKGEGEAGVRDAFPTATIVRPSIVVGPEDDFFNRFARLMKLMPIFMAVPGLATKFQPVFVGDVADAVVRAAQGGDLVTGQSFELGGDQVFSFRQLLELLMAEIDTKRVLIDLPVGIAKLMTIPMALLPNPPLTGDQLKLLGVDNVVADGAKTLADLGITPTPVSAVLPRYSMQHKPQGQFSS